MTRGDAGPRPLWLAALTVALVLVCLPRFDRHDWGFIDRFTTDGLPAAEQLADAAYYVDLVRFFRGEIGLDALQTPFSYRPLVPLIAAGVPARPLTALDVVNVVFLAFGLWALWAVLRRRVSARACVAGAALYVFSFGTFYYGAVGYVDGAVLGLLAVGLWLAVSGRTGALVAFMAVAPFAKEQTLVLLPVLAAQQWSAPAVSRLRALGTTLAAAALAGGALWLSRRLFVAGDAHVWQAGLRAYRGNLAAEEVLKYLLGYGLPGALLLYALWRRPRDLLARRHALAPFVAGAAGGVTIALYGRLCCPAGGRLSWLTAPFLIPLALVLLRGRSGRVGEGAGGPN